MHPTVIRNLAGVGALLAGVIETTVTMPDPIDDLTVVATAVLAMTYLLGWIIEKHVSIAVRRAMALGQLAEVRGRLDDEPSGEIRRFRRKADL